MKPVVLTVSPGRSGTQLLHSLLMRVKDMDGDHEDERYPSFASVRRKNLIDPSVGREYVKNTIEMIENLPGKYYSLTDLSSSYGAIEHYLDLGVKPNVIVLRRDPRLVAKSYFSLDFISRAPSAESWVDWKANDWYPFPGEQGSLPIITEPRLHSYQNCYWVCCDNEWRAQRYLNQLPNLGCRVWETSIEDMIDTDKFNSMLEYFELPRIDSSESPVVDKYTGGKLREVPPRDFLHKLELDVLNRIPTDFKNNLLERGWGN